MFGRESCTTEQLHLPLNNTLTNMSDDDGKSGDAVPTAWVPRWKQRMLAEESEGKSGGGGGGGGSKSLQDLDDGGDDASILLSVAEYFVKQRQDGGGGGGERGKGGLDEVFEDFVASNCGYFEGCDPSGDAGATEHSFRFSRLHEDYLRTFEQTCEWVVEVNGGNNRSFITECQAALDGDLPRGLSTANADKYSWFLDVMSAALEYNDFYAMMVAAQRRRGAKAPAEERRRK